MVTLPAGISDAVIFSHLAPTPASRQVYHNLVDATRGIVRESGVQGLYRGLGVTLVEIMPYAALQFGLYDMSKASWKKHQVGLLAGVQGRGVEPGVA